MPEVWKIISHRFVAALSTMSDPSQWALVGLMLLLFGLIACPVGLKSGFLRVQALPSLRSLGSLALVTLVSPAMVEEMIYRVALLPHPSERMPPASVVSWAAFSLLVFIASHVVQISSRSPARAQTYRHPLFLGLAALLGVECTAAYLTSGSIWSAVLIHWAIVVVWLGFMSGYRRLSRLEEASSSQNG